MSSRNIAMSEIDLQDFTDLAPYTDEQVAPLLQKLLQEPLLYKMMEWLYPNISQTDVVEMYEGISTVREFQEQISGPAFKVITQMTTSGLSFTNMETIDKDKRYLFLSNHRDIVLDSALLNVSLMEKGYETTQIAIGDNLLQNPLIYHMVRVNRNFIVHRDSSPREQLKISQRLSNYIRHTLLENNESIWIAHKEGRSKDGDDRTASGLLRMLSMSYDGPVEEALKTLNIMPMVVSYEYDPCDVFKAQELMSIKEYGAYEKQPDEDFRSMMKGLTGHKGRVNIAVAPLDESIFDDLADIANKKDRLNHLTTVVDAHMHTAYRLWPSNYIAYDILHGGKRYSAHYNNLQRITFRNYIRGRVLNMLLKRKQIGVPREGFMKQARETLLGMYANPVINKSKVDKEHLS